jgi:hypothetical protein
MDAYSTSRPSWPDPSRCTVEVLVVSGCPGTELAIARVREASEALGLETNMRLVIVDGEAHAQRLRFLGSPSVRVEGLDVEDSLAEEEPDPNARPIGLSCRLYTNDGVVERAPPLASIRAALARSAVLLGLPANR